MTIPYREYETIDGVKTLVKEEWCLNGIPHRTDGPAFWALNVYTHNVSEIWMLNGKYHRLDGPAYRQWTPVNGINILIRESWYLNGEKHRTGGSSLQTWRIVNGVQVQDCQEWRLNGNLHRLDGPAYQEWNILGELTSKVWYINGIHREKGVVKKVATVITNWKRRVNEARWRQIEQVLDKAGAIIFPGLIQMLKEY